MGCGVAPSPLIIHSAVVPVALAIFLISSSEGFRLHLSIAISLSNFYYFAKLLLRKSFV